MDTASLARRVAACAVVLVSIVVFARAAASPSAALGADPQTAPLKFASATITGTVSYSGTVPGVHTVWAGAFTATQGVPPAYAITRTGPGAYTLIVATGADYYIAAGMDADDSGSQPNPPVDPVAYYAGNPISVTLSAVFSNVDILLTDAVPAGSISGTISYTGAVSSAHNVVVMAQRLGDPPGPPAYSTVIFGPGPYTITNVTQYTYTVSAFLDRGDDMGAPQPNEPLGVYDPSGTGTAAPVVVSGSATVTDIDITLLDPYRAFLPLVVRSWGP